MKAITRITITLFLLLAILALVLSYTGLQETAANNGKPGTISYFWPALIDGGLIIFSLAIIYRALRNEVTKLQWFLVLFFTCATVAFNVFQSSHWLTSIFVKASAPVVLVLTFETLMSIIRSRVKRDELLDNLEQLRQQLQAERQQFENEKAGMLSERQQFANKMQAEQEQLQAEKDKLKTQIARLKTKQGKLLTQVPELSDSQKQIVGLINEGVTKVTHIANTLDTNRNEVYTELRILEALGVITNNGDGPKVI